MAKRKVRGRTGRVSIALRPKAASQKRSSPVAFGLDAAAQKWLRLLDDPCSGELVPPCYEDPGTGLLTRVHDIIYPNATAKDFVYEFTPSVGANWTHRWGWSDTTGGSLGNAGVQPVGGLLGSSAIGRARCVAACVRLVYTGPELNRRGVVSGTLDAGATLVPSEAISWTAAAFATTMPKVSRFGSASHEFKWAPGTGDSHFRPTTDPTEEWDNMSVSAGNSLAVTLVNVEPGAFYLDVISVWEYQPAEEQTTGMVALMRTPPSRNTFNAIIRGLGDLGRWATGEGAPMVARGLQALGVSPNLAGPAARIGAQMAALAI